MTYTPDSFRRGTPERPMGTEMEYHISTYVPQPVSITPRLAEIGIKRIDSFCSDGSRIYIDNGNLEYASPPGLGPHEAALADMRGMVVIDDLTKQYWESIGAKTTYPVFRRSGTYGRKDKNSAPEICGRGYHQNHLMPSVPDYKRARFVGLMGSFLATRPIWEGTGFVTPFGYRLSQKEDGIGSTVVIGHGKRTTHYEKPLAGILCDEKTSFGWNILETRCADSHMSLELTEHSLAMTSLMLRLFEHDELTDSDYDDLTVQSHVSTLHAVSRSPLGSAQIKLSSGKTATAASLQEHYAERLQMLADRPDVYLPEDELALIEKQIILCQKLAHLSIDDLEPLSQDVEWIAKLDVMRKKLGEDSYLKMSDKTWAFDNHWHRIDEKSIGLLAFKHLGDPWSDYIEEHGQPPLPRTSAAIRARAIEDDLCIGADWHYVTDKNGKDVMLYDYWATGTPRELIDAKGPQQAPVSTYSI